MPSLSLKQQCSRCTRVEYTDIDIKDVVKLAADDARVSTLLVMLDGNKAVDFAVLCKPCRIIVGNLVESLRHQLKKVSAERGKEKASSTVAGGPHDKD